MRLDFPSAAQVLEVMLRPCYYPRTAPTKDPLILPNGIRPYNPGNLSPKRKRLPFSATMNIRSASSPSFFSAERCRYKGEKEKKRNSKEEKCCPQRDLVIYVRLMIVSAILRKQKRQTGYQAKRTTEGFVWCEETV